MNICLSVGMDPSLLIHKNMTSGREDLFLFMVTEVSDPGLWFHYVESEGRQNRIAMGDMQRDRKKKRRGRGRQQLFSW